MEAGMNGNELELRGKGSQACRQQHKVKVERHTQNCGQHSCVLLRTSMSRESWQRDSMGVSLVKSGRAAAVPTAALQSGYALG